MSAQIEGTAVDDATPHWPADSIERWPLERLTPYARNARTHSDRQIAQLVASMRQWGFTIPVLVDESGGIIAGHGRVLAAQQLVSSGDARFAAVPVMIARGWSEAQCRAYVIADNQLALNAEWNMRTLALELEEITQLGIDVDLLGFSDADLASIEAIGATLDTQHWQGMPEFEQPNAMAFRDVVVHFRNQADVDAFALVIGQKITEGQKFVWYPPEPPFPAREFRYDGDAAAADDDDADEAPDAVDLRSEDEPEPS